MSATRFPVNLGGHDYLADVSFPIGSTLGYRRESALASRDQQNRPEVISEQSIVRDDLWKRAQESWIFGAGQSVFDRESSASNRFRSSKGIDPWTEWELKLLKTVDSKRSSANTNLELLYHQISGVDTLWLADGGSVFKTTSLAGTPTWTAIFTQVGTPLPVRSITSDGTYVYIALGGLVGGAGIWRSDVGGTTSASWQALQADLIGFVKGRLMAAVGFRLYNVLSATTQTELTPADFNPGWTWDAFCEGPSQIYAAGHAGGEAAIYRITISAEGTVLGSPIHAGSLPSGEIIYSMTSYLGTTIIGTNKGVRAALTGSDGSLTIGPIIEMPLPVRCMTAYDRFIWFGWTNYDATSTGLGRVDLLNFTKPVTPAYASDLMATAQGDVLSVVTFGGRRVFAVSGVGVFYESTDLVALGTLDSGIITYGLQEPKVALASAIRHKPLSGRVELALSADSGAFDDVNQSAGQMQTSSDITLIEPPIKAESTLEARVKLYRDTQTPTAGPVLVGYTVFSEPTPRKAEIITVPLLLHEEVVSGDGEIVHLNPEEEFDFLKSLERAGKPVDYREGRKTQKVLVQDVVFIPHKVTSDGNFENGLAVVRLKAFA